MKKQVEFNKESLKAFKKRYDEAVKNNEETFSFNDDVYVTTFAKYMIEYLESKFKKK